MTDAILSNTAFLKIMIYQLCFEVAIFQTASFETAKPNKH